MRKKLFCLLLVFVLALSCTGIAAFAGQPDRAYTYEDDVAVPSTNLFKVKKIVYVMQISVNSANETN